MIVASHNKGWKIITQRSHGLLAAMIAYQYDIKLPNDVIVPTLIAIAEHDDGVVETLENKNLTDAGAPRNFLLSDNLSKTELKQYLNVMELATSKCQLNALLTSMHLNFIFGGINEENDSKLNSFLKEQEINRKQILKHLNIDKNYLERLYRLVEWCDAFSLLICLDKIQPEGRKMEVSESPDGDINQVFYKDENIISLEPWVFKENSFTVFYEYRIVEQIKFDSVEEFNEIFSKSPVLREEFILSK